MSSSPYWCHTCHNIVRISSSPRLTCPTCGFGFVEEISSDPTLLLVSPGRLPLRDNGEDRTSGDVGTRHGFLRHLFRSSRRNRPASEGRPTILQLVELWQRSVSREDSTDDSGSQPRAVGFSSMNDEDALLDFDGVPRTARVNGDERLSGRSSPVQSLVVDESPHYDALGPRPLDLFLQRLLSTLLQSGQNGSPPASKAAVAAMPTFQISKRGVVSDVYGGLDEADDECAVCKEVFEIGGEVKEMPCKHVYHSNCILPWLEMHSSCPLCRYEMPVDAEEQASSSTTLEGGGEPTIVFIGISSGGIYAFSFMILGVGNRTEPTSPVSQERVQGIQASNMVEEETTVNMGDGVTVHVDLNDEVGGLHSFTGTALATASNEGYSVLNEARVSSENVQGLSSNVGDGEQCTEENESYSKANGYSLACDNNSELPQSGSYGDREVRWDNEGDCDSARVPHDEVYGTRITSETRMHQLPTGSGARAESSSSGSRGRSFFSRVFRQAALRNASSSYTVEVSSLRGEGNGEDVISTVESGGLRKNEA